MIQDNIKNLIKHNNHNNICLYGKNDNLNILKKIIYEIKPYSKFILKYNNDIEYYHSSDNIYILDMKYIKYKNKLPFIEFIDNITYINNKKVIFNNFHLCNKNIQNILKVIIEKKFNTYFYILSDNISNIIEAIKSRFICIRVPIIKIYEKWKLVKYNYNVNINDFLNNKTKNIDYLFELYKLNDYKKNHIIDILIKYIYTEIKYNNNNDYIEIIKQMSYFISTISIEINIVIHTILNFILSDHEITNSKKTKIINFLAYIEHKYKRSFYKMIYYEYILLEIKNIIYN